MKGPFIGSLSLALLMVACATAASPASGGETIVIASDLPSSAYPDARDADQAIGFAIRNQAIPGFKLAYWSLDDSLSGRQSQFRGRENVERMIDDSRVIGMVGPWTSPLGLVELPAANPATLAMVSPSATNSCLTDFQPPCTTSATILRPKGTINFFRIAPPDGADGRAMARWAAKRGLKRVAVLNEFGQQGLRFLDGFQDQFAALGGQVVRVESLPKNTTNFAPFLSRARDLGADGIYALGSEDDHVCQAALQMRQILPQAAFLGTDGIAFDANCVKDIGADAAEGIVATYPDVDPRANTDPRIKRQVDAYLKAYPKASDIDFYTFAAYDATLILIDAIRRAIARDGGHFPSRSDVVAAVAATNDFPGVTGTYSFDKNGDAVNPLMSFYEVHGGKWVAVSA